MVGCNRRLSIMNLLPLLGFVVTLLIHDVQSADKMVFPDEVARQSRQANDGCDITVNEEEGWIFTPNYPSNYDNQRDCTFVIKKWRRNVCQVQMTINDFDLGDSSNCRSDYLDIRQGSPNAGARLICGSLPSGTKKKLTFPRGRDSLTLRFHSDVSQTFKGFMIKLKQIPNSCNRREDPDDKPVPPVNCDRYLADYSGTFTSPNYPDNYPGNSRCRYTLQKPEGSVCKVEVVFRSFELEQSPSCRNDFLELPGGARLCGVYLTPAVLEYLPGTNSMAMTFFTDSYGSAPGFEAQFRQLRNSCGRDRPPKPVLNPQPLQPQPPQAQYYPTYTNVGGPRALSDAWNNLNRLGLQLYYRLLGAGHLATVNIPQQNPYVDPDNGICGTIQDFSAVIQSDNYPRVYNPNTDCAYKIIRASQEVCRVELNFVQFDVGKGSNSLCVGDYLEVPGAGRYCGLKNRQTISVDFPSNQNELTIRFKTDSYDQRSGFRIEVRQLTHGCGGNVDPNRNCGGTYKDDNFDLISPGFQGGSYPTNEECRYVLKKSSYDVCAIEIKYNVFDVEESDDCTKDFVEIGDQKVCGKLPFDSSRTYEFPDDTLIIRFRSDNFGKNAGFFMTVKQKKC